MLKIKYLIYKTGEEYTSIMDSSYIYDSLYEVANALFNIENERIDRLIFHIIEGVEGAKTKSQVREAISNYILKLEKIMIDYFNQKSFYQIPIEEIPDYNYLDNFCIHKFVIDDREEYDECEEEYDDEYDDDDEYDEII